ncbi:MAG: nucleoside monophosphate kinase [Nanoarchaeota archaeon]|nr:nucleoside monophosphate kinase [Nanoarchaeota archaeon]
MIITISGTPGSGKSTIAKLLAKKLKLKHHSTGDFMRKMAKDRNITLAELSELAESDLSVDQEIDNWSKKLGETEDNFIIDTRLGFYFIPKAVKIFLDADIKIRVQRIFKDKRPGETAKTPGEMEKEITQRQKSESKRYQEYYNVNHYDKTNYDLLIDTSELTPEEITKKTLEYLEKQKSL